MLRYILIIRLNLLFFVFLQVLQFFEPDCTPTKCSCGQSIAFNVPTATSLVKQNCTTEFPSVTDSEIRSYIKSENIGCVGNYVKFRNKARQCKAAHIQKSWFATEDVEALHESKGNTAFTGIRAAALFKFFAP